MSKKLIDELSDLKKDYRNLSYPKAYREAILRDIRKIEDALSLPEGKRVKV